MRVRLLLGAFALTVVLFVTGCGGGGGGEVIVTPEVNISPTPTITVVERLQQLGMTGLEAMYDKFPDGGYLRVEWQDPNPVLGDGDRTDYGANKVFVRYWDLGKQTFVEVDVTSFPEVQFLATAGNPTAGGDRLLWFLNWHEIPVGGTIDITGTVRIWAEDFFAIWDRLNGGPVTSIEDSFGVTVEIIDGIVQIDDSDGIPLWIAVLAVGLSRVAPVMGWCPQIDKPWQVSREGEPVVPPVNQNPVAILTANPSSGDAPLYSSLNASGSYDPDGSIVKYEWDRDGNGSFEYVGSSVISYTYSSVGVYNIRVRVTDNQGNQMMAYQTIVVTKPVAEPVLTSLDLSPETATLGSSGHQQFYADAFDQDNNLLAAAFAWSLTGPGTLSQGGYYTAPSSVPVVTTTTIKVVATFDGKSLERTAIVYLTADPSGPIWGDDPYDYTKVVLDVTPETITLHSSNLQTQQVFADLFYDGGLVFNGSRGRYFEITYSTNAPGGSLTADGLFDSTISGNGSFVVTVTATLQTIPTEHNVFTVNIPVEVVN